MPIERRLGLLIFAPMLCIVGLSAQQKAPSTPPAVTSSISLDVVVTPKSGAPVADLQQQDFTIFDNKTPRHITSFHAFGGSQAPIHVFIVVDGVNLPYERIAYARGEIDKFLHANGGQLAYPTELAFVVDKGVQIQQGFSTNGNELSSSLNQYQVGLRDIRRSSQFQGSDRFNLSITALRSLLASEAKLPGRKLILWVSPGWPILSGPRVYLDPKQSDQLFSLIVELSTQMREAGVTLYNVNPIGAGEGVGRANYYEDFLKGVSKPGQVSIGNLSLQVLAVQSGGLTLYGSNDITSQLAQCVADGKAYYEMTFDPPTADHRDEYHHIEVQVAKPGLIARTRDGYYLQP
jgi:VWFA-related protein